MRLRSLQGSPYTIADMSHPHPILSSNFAKWDAFLEREQEAMLIALQFAKHRKYWAFHQKKIEKRMKILHDLLKTRNRTGLTDWNRWTIFDRTTPRPYRTNWGWSNHIQQRKRVWCSNLSGKTDDQKKKKKTTMAVITTTTMGNGKRTELFTPLSIFQPFVACREIKQVSYEGKLLGTGR